MFFEHSKKRDHIEVASPTLSDTACLLGCVLLTLLLWLFPLYVFAADLGCGRDTDNSGTVDRACPAAFHDADLDGDTDDGRVHPFTNRARKDCDDSNPGIVQGTVTASGCAGGSFRLCQDDGTYTACVAQASIPATFCNSPTATGFTNVYFIDPTKTADTGSGTNASPWSLLSLSDSGRSTYHAPAAGDCFILQGTGNFTGTWSAGTKMFEVNNKDGTSSNWIGVVFLPGSAIVGQGVSPTEIQVVNIVDSDYWIMKGPGVAGTGINSGYSNAGIYYNGGSHAEFFGLDIHDIRGNRNFNLSGFKQNGGSYVDVHTNLFYDNYDSADPTDQNNSVGGTFFQGDNNRFNFNVVFSTVGGGAHLAFRYKHGYDGTGITNEFIGNIAHDFYSYCIGSNTAGIVISHNLLKNCTLTNNGAAIVLHDWGGSPRFRRQRVRYNTAINSGAFEYLRNGDDFSYGFDTWNSGGSGSLEYDHNVMQDDRATSYPSDGVDGMFRVCHYCDDTAYTDIITANTVKIHDNLYYNTAATTPYFDIFDDGAGSGAGYSSIGTWAAAYDTSAVSEDPLLDAQSVATSTNGATKGWGVIEYTASATSTGTTTGGGGGVITKNRRRRK